ncbi:MAG: esterase family protein [Erysipelotrichaceae bacterium]|nr:esterase family protein [Erysipelotrichaceae bacterium]
MHTEYYKEYSHNLNRDMEFKVYGHGGKPMLVFPSQNGRFFDFENNGMVGCIQRYIDEGRIQLFCCDCVDDISWSAEGADPRWRIENHEKYYHYICDELCPRIFEINAEHNGGYYYDGIMTTGCSMGATHAATFFFRRPDLFAGCIALSGVYSARFFFGDYMDDLVYANSPCDFIQGMANDHPYVEMYRNRQIIICVGQGAWEHPMIEDTARIKELLGYKGVDNAWIDFWGYDIAHDWPYWRMELPYFVDKIC